MRRATRQTDRSNRRRRAGRHASQHRPGEGRASGRAETGLTGRARRRQASWAKDVHRHGALGPPGLKNTPGALDPALWFYAKWGCTYCEQQGKRIAISPICAESAQGKALLKKVRADATGAFTTQITTPLTATPGRQHVKAKGSAGAWIAKRGFLVTWS
jgi:hypothetical protein